MTKDIDDLNKNGIRWTPGEGYYCSVVPESDDRYYVYRHICSDTGKCYVGYSANPVRRWATHISESCSPDCPIFETKFKKAIRTHGKDSFLHEILCIVPSKEIAFKEERRLIEKHDSYRSGYNSSLGGEGQQGERITYDFIVERAKEFFAENGQPPMVRSGAVKGGHEGDTWAGYDFCLREGLRGLPGESSIAKLLTERCGFVYQYNKPQLSEEYILKMAEIHKNLTGKWPTQNSGSVLNGYDGDNWKLYENALQQGGRGLAGGSSIAKLINKSYVHIHDKNKSQLTQGFIIARAKEFFSENGKYPLVKSGEVKNGYPGDTWNAYDRALTDGLRGLPGGDSLKKLLGRELGASNHMAKPHLSEEFIMERVNDYKSKNGKFPSALSGAVEGGHPGDTWRGYETALQQGLRGLTKGDSLSRLIKRKIKAV